MASTSAPFRLDSPGDLVRIRQVLEDKGYVQSEVAQRVDTDDREQPLDASLDVVGTMGLTAGGGPLDQLVRLFMLARTLPEDIARQVLAPLTLEELERIGLLQSVPDGVRAAAALVPFDDLLIVRDFWTEVTGERSPVDYVPGVGPATLAVASLTVRRQGETVLDLGTGSGFLALKAARHAARVVATDLNPRVLNFAAFNAGLNNLTNVEFRLGSLYEPVADCRFDLIVSNPPFVISPQAAYQYRDGGMAGDSLSELVLRGGPALLNEYGFCTVLFNWHHKNDDDWAERPSAWLQSCGCDVWFLCSYVSSPVAYAAAWLRQAYKDDTQRRLEAMGDWMAYYERLGIGRISLGMAILRRRSTGTHWFRAEKAPSGWPMSATGPQIQRIFAAEDFLDGADDDKLLSAVFALTDDHQLQQEAHAESGRWNIDRAALSQVRGFAFTGNIDRFVLAILAACDGARPLGQIAASLADSFHADLAQFNGSAVALVGNLLRTGFLTVVGE